MARYIECEAACAEVDKGDLLVGNNAEFAKEIINRTPTADVVPKSEVELILENNQMCLEIIETQDLTIQIAKENIARLQTLPRKLIEEIERLLAIYSYTDEYGKEVIGVDVEEPIAELKKKYTEEQE